MKFAAEHRKNTDSDISIPSKLKKIKVYSRPNIFVRGCVFFVGTVFKLTHQSQNLDWSGLLSAQNENPVRGLRYGAYD